MLSHDSSMSGCVFEILELKVRDSKFSVLVRGLTHFGIFIASKRANEFTAEFMSFVTSGRAGRR